MLKRFVVLSLIAALLLPAAADAATKKRSSTRRSSSRASSGPTVSWWGPRLGISSSPDQFVIGGQLDFREVMPGMGFSPNIEFGFGDNVTWTAVNGDLKHHFMVRGSAWRPYLGGGLSMNFWNYSGQGGDASGSEFGANLILGAVVPTRQGSRFFTEARIGLGDIPDLKLMAGWNFRM